MLVTVCDRCKEQVKPGECYEVHIREKVDFERVGIRVSYDICKTCMSKLGLIKLARDMGYPIEDIATINTEEHDERRTGRANES